jgi:putative spermidine/putrescine transport system substrate-binding protein
MDPGNQRERYELTRRALLKRAGIAGSFIAMPSLLAACGDDEESGGGGSSGGTSSSAPAGESPELTKLLDGIKSKQVIIGNYGGTTEDSRRVAFWDPFTERTGVKVVPADIPGNLGNQMLAGEVPAKWDAFHGSPSESLTARLNGKKELPTVPEIAYEDLLPEEFQPYAFQSFFVGYVPATLPGTFTDAQPQTWADFFDTKKFPGKRSWPAKFYTSGTHEAALLADGVAPDEIYPMDIERAHAKIESILDDLVVYEEFPQAQSFLTSKTVSMSYGPNGLWKGLMDKNVDVEVLWTMTPVLQPNSMCIMPDAPDMDAVMALAAFCNDPARQAVFANRTSYGPPSQATFDELSEDEKALLPNAPGREVVEPDIKWLAENESKLLESNNQLFS